MDVGLFKPQANVEVSGGPAGLASWRVVGDDPSGKVQAPRGTRAYHVDGKQAWDNVDGDVTWVPVVANVPQTEKGQPGGVATLNASGHVPQSEIDPVGVPPVWQAPSYSLGPGVELFTLVAEDIPVAGALGAWPAHIPGKSDGTGGALGGGGGPSASLGTEAGEAQVVFASATKQYCAAPAGVAAALLQAGKVRPFTVLAKFAATGWYGNVVGLLLDDYCQLAMQNNPGITFREDVHGIVQSPITHRAKTIEWAAWVYDPARAKARVVVNGTSTEGDWSALDTYSRDVKVGLCYDANGFDGAIHEVHLITEALTDAQIYALVPRMFRRVKMQVLGVGDSISAGVPYGSHLAAAQMALGRAWWVTAAYTMGGVNAAQCLAQLSGRVMAQVLPTARKVLFFWPFTNSIMQGASLVELQGWAEQALAFAKQNGMALLTATELPRGNFDAAQEAIRVAFNQWKLTNPSLCSSGPGWVLDYASLPHAANTANLTYYADGIHPTDALAADMGNLFARQLRTLFVGSV